MDNRGNPNVRPNTGAFRFGHADPFAQVLSVLSQTARGGLNPMNQRLTMQMLQHFPRKSINTY